MSQYGNDGTWKVICPRCGFSRYSDEMRKEWTGVHTCRSCWEIRHPQELYRQKTEDSKLPFAYPDVAHPEVSTAAWVGLGETDEHGTPT